MFLNTMLPVFLDFPIEIRVKDIYTNKRVLVAVAVAQAEHAIGIIGGFVGGWLFNVLVKLMCAGAASANELML